MFLRITIYTLIQEAIIFGILLFGKNQSVSLSNYVDISFMVALIALLIGLFVYIMRSGFLTAFIMVFEVFLAKLNEKKKMSFQICLYLN